MSQSKTIQINRAPVLTLWAAVVAEQLGHNHDTALTLGKAVAGLNAQAKGRMLGIFKPSEKPPKRPKEGEELRIEVCGREVPAVQTTEGIRAVVGDKPISPKAVESYLERAFGDDLGAVKEAMSSLAKSYNPEELKEASYDRYVQFRPTIPSGARGWGAKGELDLNLIRSLAKQGAR